MSERMTAILAGGGVVVVAIGVGIWLARLGAWGLVAFTAVLAGIVVWLLVRHERHRPGESSRGGRRGSAPRLRVVAVSVVLRSGECR